MKFQDEQLNCFIINTRILLYIYIVKFFEMGCYAIAIE